MIESIRDRDLTKGKMGRDERGSGLGWEGFGSRRLSQYCSWLILGDPWVGPQSCISLGLTDHSRKETVVTMDSGGRGGGAGEVNQP